MKKRISKLVIIICMIQLKVAAQQIINFVPVGKNGITENIKEAISFIVVKKYPGGIYERLDYKMSGPLIMLRSYSDSNLSIQQGVYLEYYPNGELHIRGEYKNNLSEKDWYYYNNGGKHVLTETFKAGTLTRRELPDTVKKIKDTVTYGDEREADMNGGGKTWLTYLQQNMKADVSLQSKKGGSVRVLFAIDTEGNTTEIYLKKSVEFILDEEAIRVIRASPKWVPAFQNGNPLKAYRIQPLTFEKN